MSDTRLDISVENLMMGGGTEWKGPLDGICDRERIHHEAVPLHSPQFDGCVERGIAMLEVNEFAAWPHEEDLF